MLSSDAGDIKFVPWLARKGAMGSQQNLLAPHGRSRGVLRPDIIYIVWWVLGLTPCWTEYFQKNAILLDF